MAVLPILAKTSQFCPDYPTVGSEKYKKLPLIQRLNNIIQRKILAWNLLIKRLFHWFSKLSHRVLFCIMGGAMPGCRGAGAGSRFEVRSRPGIFLNLNVGAHAQVKVQVEKGSEFEVLGSQ
jgi:hypothetical protein